MVRKEQRKMKKIHQLVTAMMTVMKISRKRVKVKTKMIKKETKQKRRKRL
jgi:hypothetical protein